MHKLVKKPLAETDLISIWEYSYKNWGEDKAVEYLLQLETGMQEIISNPNIGQSREYIRKGYRSIQIAHHVIYYRVDTKTIDIIRVLHERMLPSKHL